MLHVAPSSDIHRVGGCRLKIGCVSMCYLSGGFLCRRQLVAFCATLVCLGFCFFESVSGK